MQLQDIEMTQSLGFKDSSYSCRLSQKSVSPPKKMKYKCYECTGNQIKSSKCKSCHNTKEISQNNPLVGLLLQVMTTKLGKNIHTIKQLPKLLFDHGKQTKKTYNTHHNINTQNSQDKYYQNKYRHHFSQTNSINDSTNSNSMDSSFDSIDSTSNMSDFMNKNKQKNIKNIKNNYHHLQFKHQISQIKQQTYASEETYPICQICQKQADIGTDYMKCKICHHYNICINCYQNKKIQSQQPQHPHSIQHSNSQPHQKPTVQMRRAITTFTYDKVPSPVKVYSNIDIPINRTNSPVNNSHINPHHHNHNPDSFIHEHPLTKCKYNEEQNKQDSKGDHSPTQIYNQNGQQIFSIYGHDKDIKFPQGLKSISGSSYNIRVQEPKSLSRRQSQLASNSGNYQKLFKTYDNEQDQESPQKTKKNFINKSGHYKQQLLSHIETINEQRQSPSPSQKSMAGSPYNHKKDSQTESLPDINKYQEQSLSQVISQQCEQKLQNPIQQQENIEYNLGCQQTKSQKQYESPLKSQSQQSEFNKNISMTISHNFDNNSSIKQQKNNSYFNQQKQNIFNNKTNKKHQNQNQNIENDQIMPLETQTQSRILQSNSQSKKSNQQSYHQTSIDSDQQIQPNHQTYSQTKYNKSANITHNDQPNSTTKKYASGKQRENGEQYEKEMQQDQIQISNFSEPISLFTGNTNIDTDQFNKIDHVHAEINEDLEDEFPLVVTVTQQNQMENNISIESIKKPKQFPKQALNLTNNPSLSPKQKQQKKNPSIKTCNQCSYELQNKTIYMKCQTCQNQQKYYILCASCSSNNHIIKKHSINIKHSFKPLLYKILPIHNPNLLLHDDDDDWMKQDHTQQQHTTTQTQNYHKQIKQIQISNFGNTLNPSPLTKNPKLFQSAHSIEINSLNKSQNDKSMETQKSSENQIQKQIITLNSGKTIIDHTNQKQDSIVQSYTIMNNSQSGSLKDFTSNKKTNKYHKNNPLTKTSNLTPIKQVTFKQSIQENQTKHNLNNHSESIIESLKPQNIQQNQQNTQNFSSKLRNRNCSLQIDNPDQLNQQSQSPSPSQQSPSNKIINNDNRISINVGIDGQWVLPQNQVLLHNSISMIPSRVSLNSLPLTDGTSTIQGQMQGINNENKNGKNIYLRQQRHYDSPDKQDETYANLVVLTGKGLGRKRSSTQQANHESPESPFQRKNKPTKKSNKINHQNSNQFEHLGQIKNRKIVNKQKEQQKQHEGHNYESPGKIGPYSRVKVDVGQSDNSQMDIQFRESSHKKRIGKSDKKEFQNQLKGNWILDENQKPRQSITGYERESENIIPVEGPSEHEDKNQKYEPISHPNGLINKSLTESQMLEEEQQEERNEKWEQSAKQINNQTRQTSSTRRSSQNNQGNRCSPISSRTQNYKGFMFPLHNSSGNPNIWKKNQMEDSPSNEKKQKMNFLMKVEQSQKLQKSEDENENSDDEDKIRYANVFDKEDQYSEKSQRKGKVHFNCQEQNKNTTEPFIFEQYSCDMCAETPQNFRYHCKICKDYDLCAKCYLSKCNTQHQHQTNDFEQIDKIKQLELDKQDQVEENQKNQEKAHFINKIVQKILPSICIKQTINRFSTNSLTRSSVTRHSISYKQNSGMDSSSRLSYAGLANPYQSGFIPRQRGSHKF